MALLSRLYIYVLDGGQGVLDDPVSWIEGVFTVNEVTVTSVDDMVTKVLARIGSSSIQNLFISGHGAPGYQGVGGGTAWDYSGNKSLQVDPVTGKLKGTSEQLLRKLSPKFTKEAIATLGGCKTGNGPQGEALLKAVADCFGIPVQAGTDNQRPFVPGMEGDVIRCDSTKCSNLGGSWWASPGSWVQ
ncbi:MAG: hypothetical protein FIA97_05895 [Methylococcaceae bacterium]|nr:hypothetical protein [Methylococcaceae bacterium]